MTSYCDKCRIDFEKEMESCPNCSKKLIEDPAAQIKKIKQGQLGAMFFLVTEVGFLIYAFVGMPELNMDIKIIMAAVFSMSIPLIIALENMKKKIQTISYIKSLSEGSSKEIAVSADIPREVETIDLIVKNQLQGFFITGAIIFGVIAIYINFFSPDAKSSWKLSMAAAPFSFVVMYLVIRFQDKMSEPIGSSKK